MSTPRFLADAQINELVDVTKDTWFACAQTGGARLSKAKAMNMRAGGVGFVAKDPNSRAIAEDTSVFLQLSVETYDDWNTLESDDFTVPVTGLYLVEMRLSYNNQPGGRLQLAVQQGASIVQSMFAPVVGSKAYTQDVALVSIVRLTKAQNVKFLVARPDDGDGTFTIQANSTVKCHLV